ncbi:phosphate ABC transporter substrate-binding protein [Novosphingobium flavum]|uniref:Phosphate ABC transporter substrate-binding protein n=1 Tax=Novosphingobium flavum TaxID=1778672 RepID=A0A7X1KLJ9_9SPHN|nr:phosphate ABC transporter substrate-binding protein [Novosphingobium flavum]MBC2665383.1 phosphate ABC transporter substrate-binding protein [Novosphingobium flavum]
MTETATQLLKLRTNLADYPVTMAMKDGRITSPLVELDYCGPKVANNAFKAMLRDGQYDAGELAIITYLQAKAWGKPWTLLPIPISGRFQQHCIAYDSERGHLSPKDIEGKKVGVRTYAQTTGLWVRGVLQHEYGVDLNKVTWMTIEDAHVAEFQEPANCQRLPAGSKLVDMLYSGELAAVMMGGDMPKDPRIATLIPDAKAAAKEWHARENVVPINHMFVVHDEVARDHPDAVREIFRMLAESRAAAETPEIFPPIGLEANRKALELAIEWSFEQRLIPRRLTVDELFTDLTASLTA